MKFALALIALSVAVAYRMSTGSKWSPGCKPVGTDPESGNAEDQLKGVGQNLAASLGMPTVPEDAFAVPEQQETGELPEDESPAA